LDFAKKLKQWREKKGLTQEGLARKAEISYNTVIKLETGGIKDPRVSTIIKIAKALEITMDELLLGE
jgi:transcriptional regulator with XRE-family HTH domain